MPSILILTNRIPYPLHDGGALAMDAMIRGYQQAGWQVYLLAMNTSRHEVEAATWGKLYPEIAAFHTVAVDNAVTTAGILKNLLLSRKPEHVDRFRSPAYTQALIGLLTKIHPDVVQLESPFLGSCIADIRKFAPAAIVAYRMHNVEGQIWGRLAAETTGIKRHYLHLLATRITRYERRLWAEVDLILPITSTDATIVRNSGITSPVELAPYGITITDRVVGVSGDIFKFYHIGAMDWLPNAEAIRWFLDEVWPGLHAQAPELSFHFAGRNMPEAFFRNLPEAAFCEGEVPDAATFVAAQGVLVVPLRSGGGVRIKILEAMAAGKLVISTEVGMQGIDARAGRDYLRAESAQDFIDAGIWVLEHPAEAAVTAASGQELVLNAYEARAVMARIVHNLESMIPA